MLILQCTHQFIKPQVSGSQTTEPSCRTHPREIMYMYILLCSGSTDQLLTAYLCLTDLQFGNLLPETLGVNPGFITGERRGRGYVWFAVAGVC